MKDSKNFGGTLSVLFCPKNISFLPALTRHSEVQPIRSFVHDSDQLEVQNFEAYHEVNQFPGG